MENVNARTSAATSAEPRKHGVGSPAPTSLQSMENSLAANLRSALSVDEGLVDKMQDLLNSLPKCGGGEQSQSLPEQKEVQWPISDSSRAEFEAVITAAREQFTGPAS